MFTRCNVFIAAAKSAIGFGFWFAVVGGLLGNGLLSHPSLAADSPAAEGDASGIWVTAIAPVDAEMMVAATADGLLLREASVCRFEPQHPETLEPLYAHPAAVWAVDATADGKRIASSDYRGNLGLYDVESQQLTMHEGVLERWSQALSFSPDDSVVVAGNEGGKLLVFDLASATLSKSLELGKQAIAAIAFSPDGKQIAASDGSGKVHLVRWPELESIGSIQITEEAAWGVAFVDNETFVVGSSDRHLYRCAATPDAKPESILGGSDWITQIAVSPSGQIAAAELGGAVHLTTVAGGGNALAAPSSVWSVLWSDASTLLVGTRKHGVVTAAQSWTWAEPKPVEETEPSEPAPETEPAETPDAEAAAPETETETEAETESETETADE